MAETKPAPYEAETEYDFTLMQSVKIDGARLSRMERHSAKGAFLNKIVEREGADVIATAVAR